MVRDFRELRVWQRAMDLVLLVYSLVRLLPPEERYELGRQLRRACVSVPANIAEGNGRLHVREYIHHVYIARGSLMEVLTGLEIARRLGYVEDSTVRPAFELIDHVGRMLTRLARQLQAREAESRVPMAESRCPIHP